MQREESSLSSPKEAHAPPPLHRGTWVPPALLCLSLLLAALSWPPRGAQRPLGDPGPTPVLQAERRLLPLPALPAERIAVLIESMWSRMPDPATVPNVAPPSLPEDLEDLPVADRKRVFLRSLLPHVLHANQETRSDRQRVLALQEELRNGVSLDDSLRRQVEELARRYRVLTEGAVEDLGAAMEVLLEVQERADVVPPSLALAQAAIESGWGTSRFVRLGNNLFGQWLFGSDRGIIPLDRLEGADHTLAVFAGLQASVRAYLLNLNTYYAYQSFRRQRAALRRASQPLDPLLLATGLEPYSERGGQYVEEVQRMIRSNRLERFDRRRLVYLEEHEVDWEVM